MFCHYIFNKQGEILQKSGTMANGIADVKTINNLFKEIGVDEEWKVGKEYDVKIQDVPLKCIVSNFESNYQFLAVDVSRYEKIREDYLAHSRISDLNLNRLLKTLDSLKSRLKIKEEEIAKKNSLIKDTSHSLRTSLSDVVGLIEILDVLEESEKPDIYASLKTSAQNIVDSLDDFKID